MYLTGSVALADYRVGQSDIDAVCVVAQPLGRAEVDILRRIHRDAPPPQIDAVYVTYAELAEDPAHAKAPHAHEGRFSTDHGFDANPSVWRTLQLAPLAVRGVRTPTVWFDPDALIRWNRQNLAGYWSDWVGWLRGKEPTVGRAFDRHGLPWLVLGVSRLCYTIETLGITSKTGAGRWALDRFGGEWHPIIDHALRCRAGMPPNPAYDTIERLHADAADFADHVITAAGA